MINTEHITITSAKLKGDLYCHYSFSEEIGEEVFDSGLIKSGRPIHDDLRNKFAELTWHLPILLQYLVPETLMERDEETGEKRVTDYGQKLISLFRVSEFVIDDGAVCIIGTMTLDYGTVPVESPFIDLDGPYHYGLELQTTITELCGEIKEYIDGKQAPRYVEQDMFADGPSGTKVVDDMEEPEKPKRKRGRPKKEKPEDEAKVDASAAGDSFADGEVKTGEETPLGDDEFNKPLSEFFVDPVEAAKEHGF